MGTSQTEQELNEGLIDILKHYFTSNAQILACKADILELLHDVFDYEIDE